MLYIGATLNEGKHYSHQCIRISVWHAIFWAGNKLQWTKWKKLIYDQLLKYLFNTALRYIKLLQFIGHVYILAILLYFFWYSSNNFFVNSWAVHVWVKVKSGGRRLIASLTNAGKFGYWRNWELLFVRSLTLNTQTLLASANRAINVWEFFQNNVQLSCLA